MKRLVHHAVLAGDVEEGLLEVGVDIWHLRRLDGHCRSHNIAAECCVLSNKPASIGKTPSSAVGVLGCVAVGESTHCVDSGVGMDVCRGLMVVEFGSGEAASMAESTDRGREKFEGASARAG